MEDFGFVQMQDMQKRLQEKYKDKWESVSPENGKNKLLWLMIELGEVADIIKKRGHDAIMTDTQTREHFTEELADVLMYFNDIMLCYNISINELKNIYIEKQQKNLTRW
ncbi:MAG: MazG-like family protein [Clostridiales bacterium]|nr:MazG-like family protein [Clostridiales bacterium]